jgi:N,N'-diacetylchitobiose non-reducing end deacetylase
MATIPGLEKPQLSEAKRILAVQPHYDDNDIAAGGTLLSLAKKGVEIHYLTVTDDLVGVINTTWTAKEAREELKQDQKKAGSMLGVKSQRWLDFPDAGSYDYFSLRRQIIKAIREIRPDVIFTVDPWSPYEAHTDHIQTGKAVAEAAILYQMPRMFSGTRLDDDLQNYVLSGVVFYNTAYPNLVYDISDTLEKKNLLLSCYQTQFTESGLETLIEQTTFLAAYLAREESFSHGEALKVVAPWMLHGVPLVKDL